MFQPPGTPEMARVIHEMEMAEARRRAHLRREARSGSVIRQAIGRALVAIGVALGGERAETDADQGRAGCDSSGQREIVWRPRMVAAACSDPPKRSGR